MSRNATSVGAHGERSPPKEIDGKLRQFQRALISYLDFEQAAAIAALILSKEFHKTYPRENRVLLEALNCAMIVAYCRPFSGNDARGGSKSPDLPGRFLRDLSVEEREIHNCVIADRNQVFAHSDSEAWNMRPLYLNLAGRKTLVPAHHGVHRPLTLDATRRFHCLAARLQEAVFAEREGLEAELRPHLLTIDLDPNTLVEMRASLSTRVHGDPRVQGEE